MQRIFLTQPEQLSVTDGAGNTYRGADQDWYPRQIQRWSGCGPTAAAVMLSYLAGTRPGCRALWPERRMELEPFTDFMCQVWDYVTPRQHGLHRPEMFRDGVEEFARSRGLELRAEMLEIPAARTKRPSFEETAAFIRAGLAGDCPVAFLNLSNGKVAELDRWHWVSIAGLDGNMAYILDSGREFPIDLALWLGSTKKRGGFVTVPAAP